MIWNDEKPIRVDIKFSDSHYHIIADDLYLKNNDIQDGHHMVAIITVNKAMYTESQLKYIIEKHQGFIATYTYPSTTISIPVLVKNLRLSKIQELSDESNSGPSDQLLLFVDCTEWVPDETLQDSLKEHLVGNLKPLRIDPYSGLKFFMKIGNRVINLHGPAIVEERDLVRHIKFSINLGEINLSLYNFIDLLENNQDGIYFHNCCYKHIEDGECKYDIGNEKVSSKFTVYDISSTGKASNDENRRIYDFLLSETDYCSNDEPSFGTPGLDLYAASDTTSETAKSEDDEEYRSIEDLKSFALDMMYPKKE